MAVQNNVENHLTVCIRKWEELRRMGKKENFCIILKLERSTISCCEIKFEMVCFIMKVKITSKRAVKGHQIT